MCAENSSVVSVMQELDNYKQHPSSRLLDDPLRIPVEQLVSRHHEQPWRVKTFSDMNDFASHPSAILSDGTTAVFAKLSEALHGLDQFEVELAGLRYLTERAGVLTPTAIGIVAVPAEHAQSAVDMMVGAGIKAVWNFAPAPLHIPDGIILENARLTQSLAVLTNNLTRVLKNEPKE